MSTARKLSIEYEDGIGNVMSNRTLTPVNIDTSHLSQLHSSVVEYGPKFWGIDTGLSLAPIPQTAEYKLKFLKKSIATIPSIPKHTQAWLDGKRDKTESGIDKYRSVPINLSDEIRQIFPTAPHTAHEAYNTASIHDLIHSHLSIEGDPAQLVIDSYIEWKGKQHITESACKVGYAALELFMFGAGGKPFVKFVNDQTNEYYKTELNIRK